MNRFEETPRENSEGTPDILREYSGLLNDVSDVIEKIEANRAHEEKRHFFSFMTLDESTIVPQSVTEAIGPVSSIMLTIDIAQKPNEPSMISIDLYGENHTCMLSRSSDAEFDDASSDIIVDNTIRDGSPVFGSLNELKKVSRADINTLIMSLVSPDAERGYEMFHDVNLLTPDTLENIRDSLQYSFSETRDAISYEFESSEGSITYFRTAENPTSFTIKYPDYTHVRLVTVKGVLETDFQLSFSSTDTVQGMNTDSIDTQIDFYPTASDVRRVRQLLQDETILLTNLSTDISSDEEDIVDEKDAATIFEESGKQVLGKAFVEDTFQSIQLNLEIEKFLEENGDTQS